jgi:Mn-dependent DtxR family transcriptional regulator
MHPSGAGEERRSEDALALILGRLRAQTLRAATRPITAGRLAARLQCAPNTVTYHCAHLESAGLIVRERRGPMVWITRTARGEQLLKAFAPRVGGPLR